MRVGRAPFATTCDYAQAIVRGDTDLGRRYGRLVAGRRLPDAQDVPLDLGRPLRLSERYRRPRCNTRRDVGASCVALSSVAITSVERLLFEEQAAIALAHPDNGGPSPIGDDDEDAQG
jgi:hypothetical protein